MSAGRLVFVNSTTIRLIPYNGNRFWTRWPTPHWITIPSAGVSLSNAGAVANTTYRIYLWDNSGTLALYKNPGTLHVPDAVTGIEVDAEFPHDHYPLVGMIRTDGNTPGQFVDEAAWRATLSWANRRRLACTILGSSGTATGSTWAVLGGAQGGFLTWPDAHVEMSLTAGAWADGTGNIHAGICIDGVTSPTSTVFASYTQYPYPGYWCGNQGIRVTVDFTEGWHVFEARGIYSVVAGNANWGNPLLTAMPYG